MKFNPFNEKPKSLEQCIMNWQDLSAKPYDKHEISPYTRTRCILMNGTEFESVWFGHQFNRHTDILDLKRDLALVRRNEQQQQKLIASLKPIDESQLETTIGYEQLAVDLTAFLAQNTINKTFKEGLDFALLEDFDHLYRYANLLDLDYGAKAEDYVGGYTEITPGRPTIAHHRHPKDSIRKSINNFENDLFTQCAVNIITAAEQQTMNFYMNTANMYPNQHGRKLFTEIAMVEEEHVSHYGSYIDPYPDWFEMCLMHEYTECYLYYSMYCDESDANIKSIWEMLLEQEIAHLHASVKNLNKYAKKDVEQVIPNGNFPTLIKLQSNIDYVRKILKGTACQTSYKDGYKNVSDLPEDCNFFKYNKKVNKYPEQEAGHKVIEEHIKKFSRDYRCEMSENPISELRDRTKDNITFARTKC